MREVQKKGYMPGPIFDGVREYLPEEKSRSYLPLLENSMKRWLGTGDPRERLACSFIGSTHESLKRGLSDLIDSKRVRFIEMEEMGRETARAVISKYVEICPKIKPYQKLLLDMQEEFLGKLLNIYIRWTSIIY